MYSFSYKVKFFLLLAFNFQINAFICQNQYVDSLKQVVNYQSGKEKVMTLNELTFSLHRNATKEAIAYSEKALQLAREINDSSLLALTLNDASTPLLISGDYQKVLNYNNEVLRIRERYPDSLKTASAYAKIGHAYQELGQLERALTYYERAKSIFEQKKANYQIFQLKSNIANVFQELGRLEEAIALESEVLTYSRKLNDVYTLCNVLNNIGVSYRKLGNIEMANQFHQEMLEIAQENNILEAKAVAYQSMGVNFREEGAHKKGISYYRKALKLYEETGSMSGVTYMNYNLGMAYMDLEKLDSAELFLLNAEKHSRTLQSNSQLKNTYVGLSELAVKKGDFKTAVEFKDSVIYYKDMLYTSEGNALAADLFQKYQLSEKEKSIIEKELELSGQRGKIAYILFTSVIILMVMTVLIIRNRFIHKKLKVEMALQAELAKERLNKKLQSERLRISRDLHDSLGAELTLISSAADQHSYGAKEPIRDAFGELGDLSRNAMIILRDSIWAIRNDQLDLEDFIQKLQSFIEPRMNLIDFEITNNIMRKTNFSPAQSLHLFRICQEAIQNTIKHANADKITIVFERKNDELNLTISDNGKGFNDQKNEGSGLTHLKERVEDMKGSINLNTTESIGTSIKISIPLSEDG